MAEISTETQNKNEARVLIIATSLNPNSKSLILAEHARDALAAKNIDVRLIWLRDVPMPLCDGTGSAWINPEVARMREEVQRCTHVIFAVPIYNYDVNAAAKNLIEHIFNWNTYRDDNWKGVMDKIAGIICAAGGSHSYMSALSFTNSLALEGRWWVAPRIVYANSREFENLENRKIVGEKIIQRIAQLLDELLSHYPVLSGPGHG